MFNKNDSTLSSFINEASAEDLSAIASQVFGRVGTLDQRQQEQFIQDLQRTRRQSASSNKCSKRLRAGRSRTLEYAVARIGKLARAFSELGAIHHVASRKWPSVVEQTLLIYNRRSR